MRNSRWSYPVRMWSIPSTKKLPVERATPAGSPTTKRAWRVSGANANCWVPFGASSFAKV